MGMNEELVRINVALLSSTSDYFCKIGLMTPPRHPQGPLQDWFLGGPSNTYMDWVGTEYSPRKQGSGGPSPCKINFFLTIVPLKKL